MATTLFIKSNSSSWNTNYAYSSLIAGLVIANSITNTTAGGTRIQATRTGGGTVIKWISPPLLTAITISGTVTFNFWAKQQALANNATLRAELYQLPAGGVESAVAFAAASFGSPLTTTVAVNNWTASPTATTFGEGDRIVIYLYIVNSGTMGAGTPGVTMQYNGSTPGAAGDTWVSFTEAVSFQTEAQYLQETSNSSGSISLGSTHAGNLIVGFVVWTAGGSTISSITGCTLIGSPITWDAGAFNMQAYYATGIAGGTFTATITWSGSTPAQIFNRLAEYEGVAAFDVAATYASGNSGTATTNSLTPTSKNEILIAFQNELNSNTVTPAAGYQVRYTTSGWAFLDTSIMGTTGSYTTSCTFTSDQWAIGFASFTWTTQPSVRYVADDEQWDEELPPAFAIPIDSAQQDDRGIELGFSRLPRVPLADVNESEMKFDASWRAFQYDDMEVQRVSTPLPPTTFEDDGLRKFDATNRVSVYDHTSDTDEPGFLERPPLAYVDDGEFNKFDATNLIRLFDQIPEADEPGFLGAPPFAIDQDAEQSEFVGWRAIYDPTSEMDEPGLLAAPPAAITDDAESLISTVWRFHQYEEELSTTYPPVPRADDADIPKWFATQAPALEDDPNTFPPTPPVVTPTFAGDDLEAAFKPYDQRPMYDHTPETDEPGSVPSPPLAADADLQSWAATSAIQHDDTETARASTPLPPVARDDGDTQVYTSPRSIQYEDPETQRASPPTPPIAPDEDLNFRPAQIPLPHPENDERSLPPTPPFADDPPIAQVVAYTILYEGFEIQVQVFARGTGGRSYLYLID